MKPLLISSGEPAGIGPDLCLSLSESQIPLVILGDTDMLQERAQYLGSPVRCKPYQKGIPVIPRSGELTVLSVPCATSVIPGVLEVANAPYVLELLKEAATRSMAGEFSAIVTAPVHKGIINQAGIDFTGHTEFFENFYQVNPVVMVLTCPQFKVALVTTHLPLRQVPEKITKNLVMQVIRQLHRGLQEDFGIEKPKILVAGLNPHAGESGYLGQEEITMITPAITALQTEGIQVEGPFSADTLFTESFIHQGDALVAMYHDQGLPVLKYASFGQAVNVTLGLPVIRTSVDHGTALHLAGKNQADSGSLWAAVNLAATMAAHREKTCQRTSA
jgi:4-hydroxythreonine-4-phosphate dehydrogenase